MKRFLIRAVVMPWARRQIPRAWHAVNSAPRPERGSMAHLMGSMLSGLIVGLAYWFFRNHH
jgi:predicted lipid-binding transport protein (Tim44 family)